MMSETNAAESRAWLLIDASQEGVLRFATALPSASPRIDQVREIDVRQMPSFTDALQQFERDSGCELRGVTCAMVIAGAPTGETLSLVRSRWTITRSGLAAVLGGAITIINDVAARAWAIRAGTGKIDTVRGVGTLNLGRGGRYAMIMVEEGLGAAAIDVDAHGLMRILESEAGHTDFAPSSEREEKLARALKGAAPFVSWERMLTIPRHDPLWAQACPEMTEAERSQLLAALLGRFAVNLMHSFGAWQGVMIAGDHARQILDSGGRPAFDSAFAARRHFSRLISGTTVWRVDQRDAVLNGAAQRLAQDMYPERKPAA